jgi:hypothetical protein
MMVLCWIALPVFAVLSIFSVRYRKLTLDALECLFKTVSLRKCESGLDDRIKADLTGRAMKLSPRVASLFYNHYKMISWIMVILMIGSTYLSSVGIYNYVNYGNCNGPASTGLCLFDPTGANSKISDANLGLDISCGLTPTLNINDPLIGNLSAKVTIIEFGCYSCAYTAKAESTINEVLAYYKGRVNLQFKTFYLPTHALSYESALASYCAKEQGKYPEYYTEIFKLKGNLTPSSIAGIAQGIGLNISQFADCLKTEKYKGQVDDDTLEGRHAGVEGTPTFFINTQKIVGPKPFKTFRTIIDGELKK